MWEESYSVGVVLLHRKEEGESLAFSSWRYLRITLRCKHFHIDSVPLMTAKFEKTYRIYFKGKYNKAKGKKFVVVFL